MTKDKKCICRNGRSKIDTLKNMMRFDTSPFDGTGYFKTALAELRKEGVNIVFDKEKQRYYNPLTISKIWGY
jgi:hypothetical protein